MYSCWWRFMIQLAWSSFKCLHFVVVVVNMVVVAVNDSAKWKTLLVISDNVAIERKIWYPHLKTISSLSLPSKLVSWLLFLFLAMSRPREEEEEEQVFIVTTKGRYGLEKTPTPQNTWLIRYELHNETWVGITWHIRIVP